MGIQVSVYRRRYTITNKAGKRIKRVSPNYVIEYRGPDGKLKRVPAYADRVASEAKAAEIRKALARGEEGLVDVFADHKVRPLSQHVADYIADLKAVGRDEKYVENIGKRLNKLLAACGWSMLADINPDSFARWREALARLDDGRPSLGPVTQNQYLEAIRAFCGWAVKRGRLAVNPLLHVSKVDETSDVRRARRSLSLEQVTTLLAAVDEKHRGVYRFILATGLRRQEVADLQWGDVRLDAPMPFLKLRAKATKARRADTLPLRADIAGELRRLKGEATEGDKVFGDLPTIEVHRQYLGAADIAWEDEDGRRLDFHALRHSFGTLLSQAGVSPRETMELMRHTDLRLTMKVYTDPKIFNLAGAVERLTLPIEGASKSQLPTITGETATDSPSMRVGVRVKNMKLGVTGGIPEVAEGLKVSGNVTSSAFPDTSNQTRQVGLEPTQDLQIHRENEPVSQPMCVGLGVENTKTAEMGLSEIIAAWPSLPADIRAMLVKVVRQTVRTRHD